MAQDDVSYIPFQDDLDNSSSPILQVGSCFIMDTEAVRSSPLLELRHRDYLRQQESKKRSLAERMTCVRNNIRVDYFAKSKSGLERQQCKTLQKLHESCSKLRHEVKLLDVDRLRHEMDVRKRLEPDRDYSCEDVRLQNTAGRLDTGVTSCYLDKRMTYPLRSRSLRDTPTVKKARASLRLNELHKSLKKRVEERIASNQSVKPSSSQQSAIPGTVSRNQIQHAPNNGHLSSNTHNRWSRFPTVRGLTSLVSNHQQYTSGQYEGLKHPLQIKSSGFDNLVTMSASTDKKLTKLPSFISDQLKDSCESSEDETSHLPESVDLKAHFFSGRQSTSSDKQTLSPSNNAITPTNLRLQRKRQEMSHRLLAGTLQQEVCHVNSKVLEFLKNCRLSENNEGKLNLNELNKSFKYQMIKNNATNLTAEEKAISKLNSQADQAIPLSQDHRIDTDDQIEESLQTKIQDTTVREETFAPNKYSWKLIKGTSAKERKRGMNTVNDLVLQALTGIPIYNVLGSHVPLHAASRAMRRTATFKMHKIMEKLANERTRYQNYEMGELKKAIDGQECVKPGSVSTTEQVLKDV